MDFGKHKGELMVELPDSYLAWISRRRKGRLALWAPLADRVLHERHSSTCSSSRPPGGKVLGCEEGDEVDPIDGFSLGAAVALFGWCPEISASDETSPGKDDAGRTLESDGGDILDSNERREGTDGNQEKKKSSLHHEFNKIFRKPWKNVDQGSTLSRLGKLVVELQRSGNSTARRKPRQKLYRDHDHGNSRAKRMVFSPSSKHHGDQEHHDNAKALDRLAGLVARFDSRGHKSSGCYADFIRWCGDTGAVMDGKSLEQFNKVLDAFTRRTSLLFQWTLLLEQNFAKDLKKVLLSFERIQSWKTTTLRRENWNQQSPLLCLRVKAATRINGPRLYGVCVKHANGASSALRLQLRDAELLSSKLKCLLKGIRFSPIDEGVRSGTVRSTKSSTFATQEAFRKQSRLQKT
ncbi:hypothetical protein SELMODRAFT_404930 [Selaginella moellendorffii]|uniref:Uncharacterized protein n=1 Tax=Selaginella moellendorffii TaxID=88036 RepID=D8QXU4_SELML|nr:hypothetical protein SELMODRAFT_404930 [Selaginella moellendorffii]